MIISSVRISYPAECNCHLLYRMTSESYLMSSLPLLHLYISQLLECTYVHLSLFHSNVSNIQQQGCADTTFYTLFWDRTYSLHMDSQKLTFHYLEIVEYITCEKIIPLLTKHLSNSITRNK